MKLPRIKLNKKPTYLKIAEGLELSRYSIVGFDPAHIISARGKTLYFDDKKFEVDNPYSALREIVPQDAFSKFYAGGLIGFLSYEAVNYFEPSLKLEEHKDFEAFKFGVYMDGLVLDKVTGELFYFYYEKNRIDIVKQLIAAGSPVKRGMSVNVHFLGDSLDKKGHQANVKYVLDQIKSGSTYKK